MSGMVPFDRQVASWLAAERPPVAPSGVLEAVRVGVATTHRRPGWAVGDRWTWRHGAAIRRTARLVVVLGVVAALVALLVVVAGLVGSPRPAPPFGLATPGRIAVDTAEGIVLTNADGSNRVVLVPADGQSLSPTWSRDGLHLAYWHRAGHAGPWALLVVGADGSGRDILTEGVTLKENEAAFGQPSNISWSPGGREVAFAADSEEGSSIFVAALGRRAATRITDPALLAFDPAWSPLGDVIAFQSEASHSLHVVAPNGTGERQLANLKGTILWPDWSPDGAWIATAASAGTLDNDIYVMASDGSALRRISFSPRFESSPTWSPNGDRLAWTRAAADPNARAWVVVAAPDGSRAHEIRVSADFAPPVWSPDGSRLFSYAIGPDGTFDAVLVLDPAGEAPVVRLPAAGSIGNSNWQRLP